MTTGSFMVRGKKNFLPLSHLVLGLSFLFKLEDGCIEKHKDERKAIAPGEEDLTLSNSNTEEGKDEEEIELPDDSDSAFLLFFFGKILIC